MEKKVAVISFPTEGDAYEAFSKIKNADGGALRLKEMAVIERNEDKSGFSIKDSADFDGSNQIFRDGLIGIVIGILGGPFGILAGWIIGDLVGVSQNYYERKHTNTIFDSISEDIDPGKSGVVVYFEEDGEDLLNTIVEKELNGKITRFDYDQVKADITDAKKVSE